MAAPRESATPFSSTSDDDEKTKQADVIEELDFCSSKFNPLKALFSPNVKVPFENVKSFPSVASYEAAINAKKEKQKEDKKSKPAVPKSHVDNIKETGDKDEGIFHTKTKPGLRAKGASTSSLESKLQKIAQGSSLSIKSIQDLPARHDSHKRNVLTRMAQMSGPLELLTRCVNERLHVRVMTRAAVSVRSICRGYVVAFDKNFNMALIDVDEIYRRPACLGKIRARRSHKLQSAQRTLKMEREEQKEKFLASKSTGCLSLTQTSSPTELKRKQEEEKTKEIGLGKDRLRNIEKEDVMKNDEGLCNKLSGLPMNLRNKKSLYQDVPFPYSFYEREALMLGIPDENVEHRHVNQLFVRGENVVLVSIITD